MSRKIAFWSLLVLFIAALVIGYVYLIHSKVNKTDILNSIPSSSDVLVELNGISALSKQVNFEKYSKKNFEVFPELSFINDELKAIEGIFKSNKNQKLNLTQASMYFAMEEPMSRNRYGVFIALPDAYLNNANEFLRSFSVTQAANSSEIKGIKYFKINVGAKNGDLFIAEKSGVVLITPFMDYISVALGNTPSLDSDKEFYNLFKSLSKNKSVRCFYNLKNENSSLSNALRKNVSIYNFNNYLSGKWMSVDFSVEESKLSFNGSIQNDSLSFTRLFKDQKPVEITFPEVVPDQTKKFVFFGLGDYLSFYKNIVKSEKYSKNKISFSNDNKSDLTKLQENLTGEIVSADVMFSDTLISKFSLFKIKDQELVIDQLKNITDSVFVSTLDSVEVLSHNHLYYFKDYNLVSYLSGALIDSKSNYVFILNDFMIFANSVDEIKKFQLSFSQGKTLSKHESYQKLMNSNMNDDANLFFYSSVPDSVGEIFSANHEVSELIDKPKSIFRSNTIFGIQLTAYKERFILQGILMNQLVNGKTLPSVIWKNKLDTNIICGPFITINHNTAQKEIVVQDAKNQIYLLDSTGKTIWKKKLDARILSKVYQVDFYKNKKLQFLFNTKDKLHLIDRNGKHVDGYPVDFENPATNGINVFDYEGKSEYRICFVNSEMKLNMLQLSGKAVQGFNQFQFPDSIITSVSWSRVNNKDCIFAVDKSDVVYVFNRKGEKIFISSPGTLNHNISPIFKQGDKPGEVLFYNYFPELKEIKTIGTLGYSNSLNVGTDNNPSYYNFYLINEDDVPDLILMDENEMEVYDGLGELISKNKFESKMINDLIPLQTLTDKYFFLTDKENNLMLMESNMKNIRSLGIKCEFPFITNFGDTIISVFQDEICCFSIH
ncbi:MAG: hypothetical protein ACK5D5_08455 [Bacteroidota bacterium]